MTGLNTIQQGIEWIGHFLRSKEIYFQYLINSLNIFYNSQYLLKIV